MMNGEKFLYQLQIKEHHLDTFGHVNNAVYLELFEEARWDFITKNGFGLEKIKESGLGPVILELQVKFKKEIKNREHIRIESTCTEVSNKLLMQVDQVMLNEKDGPCCQATFIIGMMDLKKRKLIYPPPDWIKALGLTKGF